MRKLRLIGVLFVVNVLTSCSPYPRESERMEAALQRADSVYGEGENDTVLFIPGLAEASSYFAEKKQYDKAALSALYNGYAEKDYDKDEAMSSFKEAEHYGKIAHDSLAVARAQFQMGRLLYYEGSVMAGLVYSKKADKSFGKHYVERAMALNGIASSYIMLCNFDSARICLDKSLSYADMGESEDARKKALNNYAVLFKLQGEYDKALYYLRQVKPDNDEQRVLNYLNVGNLFMVSGKIDSAEFYYENLEQLLDLSKVKNETDVKLETKCAAYEDLFNLAEQQGDWEKAVGFRKEYEELLFKLFNNINQKNNYRIQKKYDYESLQNALNRKVANRQRVIVIVCGLLLLLTFALIVLRHRIAVKTKQEAEAKERALFYIQQYYDTLSKQGKTMQKVAIVMENKNDKTLLDELRKTVFGKKNPWDAIEEVFFKLHPEERQNMDRMYPGLTELERKDLILSHFDVSRQDEALLLDTNIHSIDKLRQKNKEKTFKYAGFHP